MTAQPVSTATNSGYLYSSLATDPDLAELVDLFVEEMPDRVAALVDRLQRDDWEGLCRLAHQLKGAAGSYGFDLISPCAARVEDGIRDGEPEEQIRAAMAELVEICQLARAGMPR